MTVSWPGGAPVAFALTFDLDRIRPTYHRLTKKISRDAWWNFDHLHRALDLTGHRATIFVLDQPNPLPLLVRGRFPDAFGVFRLEEVSEELRKLRRAGAELAIHGSWGTRGSGAKLRRQRERLAEAAGVPLEEIAGNRQHYLEHGGDETFRAEREAGVLYDSSLGSNDSNGVGSAGALPFSASHGIIAIPLIAMDTALVWESKRTGRDPGTIAKSAFEDVRGLGGCFTLCLHPHHFRPGSVSFDVGMELLRLAREKGAWFATSREIAEHVRRGFL